MSELDGVMSSKTHSGQLNPDRFAELLVHVLTKLSTVPITYILSSGIRD